jgi:hypothetical protein
VRCIGLALVLVGSVGCEFSTALQPTDPDAPMIDVPDVPPEAMRTRVGLCALWTFNEPAGSAFAFDTSQNPSVALEVMNAPGNGVFPAAFESGDLVASMPSRVISAEGTRLADCAASGAVTLEAWLRPASGTQGIPTEPVFAAGISGNIGERNIAIMQGGTKWVAVVRNSAANADGLPQIIPSVDVVANTMSHVVITADATRRALYVNNAPTMAGTPAAVSAWDPTYPMVLFDEYQHARQWTGRVALLAIFNRALTPDEIQTHWVLGPTAQ